MRPIFLNIICLLLITASVSRAAAEDKTDTADTLVTSAPKVYLDCSHCDFDYFRIEITFVNFVRHRQQADVHILVTTRGTGAGGEEYTIEFIGQAGFENMRDTLKHITLDSESEENIRSGLARVVQLGLLRYVARTPTSKDIRISYNKPAQQTVRIDKWNYWVFSVELDTWLNGEKSYRDLNFWWEIEARRTTERSAVELDVYGSYNESKFDYEDTHTLSLSRSKGMSGSYTFALDPEHWAAGFEGGLSSSTYGNRNWQAWQSAGLEYNIFPYSHSTRRQLRIAYTLTASYNNYIEETIYDRTDEWLAREGLDVSFEVIQPWGSIDVSFYASNYFHDFDKNRLRLYSELSLSLVQGLSLEVDGSVTRIRDQLSLRKGGATEDEVLLRRRELATSYSYYVSFGVSYTFGSIYNNIVNPRFGG